MFPQLHLFSSLKMPKGEGNKGKGPAKKWRCKDNDDDKWGQGRGRSSGGHGHGEKGWRRRTKNLNPPVQRKTGASHKFSWLNQWTPERMQAVLNLYYDRLDLHKSP